MPAKWRPRRARMQPRIIHIKIPGQPRGKGTGKISTRGKYPVLIKNPKTRAYEALIAQEAMLVMVDQEMLQGALKATVRAIFEPPKWWSKKKRLNPPMHTVKPDVDNLQKAVFDGCENIVFKRDQAIVQVVASKTYGPEPMLQITLAEIEG